MASATPDLRLPSQPQGITVHWLVPNYAAWWQRHYPRGGGITKERGHPDDVISRSHASQFAPLKDRVEPNRSRESYRSTVQTEALSVHRFGALSPSRTRTIITASRPWPLCINFVTRIGCLWRGPTIANGAIGACLCTVVPRHHYNYKMMDHCLRGGGRSPILALLRTGKRGLLKRWRLRRPMCLFAE